MEKLRSIEQFKSCKNFVIINGENVTMYEFLCIHPHNENYILALERSSMEGKKLYIPNLLGETIYHGEAYVGEFDSKFIASRTLAWHKRRVAYWEERLEEVSKKETTENNFKINN